MLAHRLALRQLAADKWRFIILVAALVVPIAAVTVWFVLRASAVADPETQTTRLMGQSQATLTRHDIFPAGTGSQSALDETRSMLHSVGLEAEAVPTVQGSVAVGDASGGRHLVVSLQGRDDDPLFVGQEVLTEGAWPTAPTEVVLSRTVSVALDAPVGGQVRVQDVSLRVVGLAVEAASLDSRFVVTTLQTGLEVVETSQGATVADGSPPAMVWHMREVLEPDVASQLESEGWQLMTREQMLRLSPVPAFDVTNVWLVALALVALGELMLIFSGVYSIVFQSRVREQALLSAIGASARFRRWLGLLDGLAVGVSAAVVGLGAGVLLARLLMPWAAGLTNEHWETLRVPYGWLLLVGVLVIIAGAGASWLASTYISTDVIQLLRGSVADDRATSSHSRRLPPSIVLLGALGILLCLGGSFLRVPLLVYAGTLTLVAAAVGGLRTMYARSGQTRSGTIGLLARRAVSQQPRRASAFAAVPLSLVVIIGVLAVVLGGAGEVARREYVAQGPPGSVLIHTTKPLARETLSAAEGLLGTPGSALFAGVAPSPQPQTDDGIPYTYWGNYSAPASDSPFGAVPLYTTGEDDLRAWMGREPTGAELAAFADGAVLSLSPGVVNGGQILVTAPDPLDGSGQAEVQEQLPALVVGEAPSYQRNLPLMVVSPAQAEHLGMPQPNESVAYLPPAEEVPDDRQEAHLNGLIAADVGRNWQQVEVERGSEVVAAMTRIIGYALAGALVAAVALTVLMTSLARYEQRGTLATLSAVGVPRRARATLLARQSMWIVGAGSFIGLLIWLLAAPTFSMAYQVPWSWLGAVAVVLTLFLLISTSWLVAIFSGRQPVPVGWRRAS